MCGGRCRRILHRITKISSRTGNIIYDTSGKTCSVSISPWRKPVHDPGGDGRQSFIMLPFFSLTATIKTISDYVTTIINNNIMWTRSARVQSSGRLLLSRIVYFYNTPTVIYPPGTTPLVRHSPACTFCWLPVPHRKSTTTVCRKEIHLTRVLTRRFIIAQIVTQYNIILHVDMYCINITV